MNCISTGIKDFCFKVAFLLVGFMLFFGHPATCFSTGIKDKDISVAKPDKEFIKHFFNATELHRKGKLDKALSEYNKAIEYDKSNLMILNSIGRIYWQKGQLNDAAAVFRQVLNKSENKDEEAKARSSLAVIYMDQNNCKKAMEELELCLDLEPEPARQMSYKIMINKCNAEIR